MRKGGVGLQGSAACSFAWLTCQRLGYLRFRHRCGGACESSKNAFGQNELNNLLWNRRLLSNNVVIILCDVVREILSPKVTASVLAERTIHLVAKLRVYAGAGIDETRCHGAMCSTKSHNCE